MSEELTCRELVELVTEYLEGALDPLDHARFERHLAECIGCRTHLEQIRRTVALIGHIDEGGIEPDARTALLHAFRTWKHQASHEPGVEA